MKKSYHSNDVPAQEAATTVTSELTAGFGGDVPSAVVSAIVFLPQVFGVYHRPRAGRKVAALAHERRRTNFDVVREGRHPMKLGTITLTLALVAMLGLAVWGFFAAWKLSGDAPISANGYVALGLAGGVTLLLGGGLMWLAFYSSRRGWDDIDRDGP
jgi:hypothetical protein